MNHAILNEPLVSIITIVYNDRDYIEKTILSVIDQTYPSLEYIIVDGKSDDGTLDIIKKYENRISKWTSDPDKGLYDAMNKGLRMASGEYVWFVNSGDRIFSEDMLELIMKSADYKADIMYGGTMIIDADGNEIGDRRLKPPDHMTWKSFRQGMLVCHQSIIVRREIAPEYNLNYRISSDVDWVIRAAKNSSVIHNTGLVLSKFLEGGLSRTKVRQGLKERFAIMTMYYGFIPTFFRHFIFGARLLNFYLKHRRI